jgi:hypothetical protein
MKTQTGTSGCLSLMTVAGLVDPQRREAGNQTGRLFGDRDSGIISYFDAA